MIRQFTITLNHVSKWNQFTSDVDKVRADVDTVNNRGGASQVYTYVLMSRWINGDERDSANVVPYRWKID